MQLTCHLTMVNPTQADTTITIIQSRASVWIDHFTRLTRLPLIIQLNKLNSRIAKEVCKQNLFPTIATAGPLTANQSIEVSKLNLD